MNRTRVQQYCVIYIARNPFKIIIIAQVGPNADFTIICMLSPQTLLFIMH